MRDEDVLDSDSVREQSGSSGAARQADSSEAPGLPSPRGHHPLPLDPPPILSFHPLFLSTYQKKRIVKYKQQGGHRVVGGVDENQELSEKSRGRRDVGGGEIKKKNSEEVKKTPERLQSGFKEEETQSYSGKTI